MMETTRLASTSPVAAPWYTLTPCAISVRMRWSGPHMTSQWITCLSRLNQRVYGGPSRLSRRRQTCAHCVVGIHVIPNPCGCYCLSCWAQRRVSGLTPLETLRWAQGDTQHGW